MRAELGIYLGFLLFYKGISGKENKQQIYPQLSVQFGSL
jgi:hypothetical protein